MREALVDIGREPLVHGVLQRLLVNPPVGEFDTVHQDHGNELAIKLRPQGIVIERDFFGDNIGVRFSHSVDDDFCVVAQMTPGFPNQRHRYRHGLHLMLK